MLLKTSTFSLFASTLLFSTSVTAAPTRAHCRCTVVADPAPTAFTPSTAHWTPTEYASDDICSNLGPELENFSHNKSNLYASYLARTEGPSSSSSAVSWRGHRSLKRRALVDWSRQPRLTTRPNSRIVCHAESDSFTTLWILQIIVAVAILACVAEGVHLGVRWYGSVEDESASQTLMRLPGSQLVLEFTGAGKSGFEVRDAEKQDAAQQQATPMVIVQAPNRERVCITYEEEYDDDEINRPVM